jgi:GH18 family chitinase
MDRPKYTSEAKFEEFVAATDTVDAKRLISVNTGWMSGMAKDSAARLVFADTLRKFCRRYDLDGIDMDWEGISNATDRDNFTLLMKDIRAEIDSTELELVITIGFGNYWLQWYQDEALDQADFLQIMIYDQTGTWAASPYGAHASMDHYKQAETYWVNTRGYPRDKLVMGLPYYGYRFDDTSGGIGEAFTYTDIMTKFPNALPTDNVLIDSTGHYFFNGASLIKEKVNYAIDNGFKGVMVWEIAQDDPSKSNSLNTALTSTVGVNSPIEIRNQGKVYPNPAVNQVTVEIDNERVVEIELISITGQSLKKVTNSINISLSDVSSGLYFLKVRTESGKLYSVDVVK